MSGLRVVRAYPATRRRAVQAVVPSQPALREAAAYVLRTRLAEKADGGFRPKNARGWASTRGLKVVLVQKTSRSVRFFDSDCASGTGFTISLPQRFVQLRRRPSYPASGLSVPRTSPIPTVPTTSPLAPP
uniref:Uncharacterized protein n=1 Tax=Mycena chlorophos TaxID=658473 RepID=A0ABQ0LQZ7_MYCCL|nr:predicted protein [Mycena chlorophos]